MNASDPLRPSPDALLRQARRAERGRLKVYLGASPGVGKTYEMLSDGAGLRAAGTDVVIGIVETHGRAETMALTQGFEIVPRRTIDYQGRKIEEMDLDALLARRPKLALVDELAHTNAPGSRHPKRHQDVDELLAAGIDVHTTVNIQHIESLNDLVASFTKVRVRETVPDSVLENAELEVVDLPPDELIQRLKDGKVYVPHEATRALGHFFSRSNLSALRELALRLAAQRVDRDILVDVAAAGLAGNWAAGERVLVAISELPGADSLVRATKRLADALRAPWVALHVETPRSANFGDTERQRLAATMQLASRLGGEVVSVPAETVLEGIKRYAADARTTQVVVGKSARSRWFEFRHGSVVDRLVRETPGIAVHVLPMEAVGKPLQKAKAPGRWGAPHGYLWSAMAVAAVIGIGHLITTIGHISNIGMLFLVPVLFAAMRYGLRTGIATGVAASLCYNFFFIPPLYTFTIGDRENIVAFLVLLGVAVVVSQLAARVQAQATIARNSAAQNSALAGLARALTGVTDRQALGDILTQEASRLLGLDTIFLSPDENGVVYPLAGAPQLPRLDIIDQAAAEWAFDKNEPTGRGSGTLTASDWMFHPLATSVRTLAVFGLSRSSVGEVLRTDQQQLLISVLDQAALALQRVSLEEEMADVAKLQERDRLQAALLSSVSHDLRTPLTSILAAVDELQRRQADAETAIIQREALRLNRFVGNLLEMVRVESGSLDLKLTAVDLTEAIASAVHDLRQSLANHPVELQVPPDLPLVRADERLLHQCLINLLENAAKFSPAGSAIIIAGHRPAGAILLQVIDEGPGLPPGTENRIFETFARLEGSDRVGGTGLGLAIVRGFATGMGLNATAENRTDQTGAIFTIAFPESSIVRGSEPC